MTYYKGSAPLTLVRLKDAGFRNVFEGEPVDGDTVEPENLKRLVRKGFLVESEAPAEDEVAESADEPKPAGRSRAAKA